MSMVRIGPMIEHQVSLPLPTSEFGLDDKVKSIDDLPIQGWHIYFLMKKAQNA